MANAFSSDFTFCSNVSACDGIHNTVQWRRQHVGNSRMVFCRPHRAHGSKNLQVERPYELPSPRSYELIFLFFLFNFLILIEITL